jgi:hypothetical protein
MEGINKLLHELHASLKEEKPLEDETLQQLFGESFEQGKALLPPSTLMAMDSYFEFKKDIFNGGMDQVVWNIGEPYCSFAASRLLQIGAIKNGNLLQELIKAKKEFDEKYPADEINADPVKYFLLYRKTVSGPYFDVPDYFDEVLDSLYEYIKNHPQEIPENFDGAPLFNPEEIINKYVEAKI